jgi:hypothetical protein
MPDDREFIESNTQSRERLQALIGRLSQEDLERSVGGGWTVAMVLAHLAFWDRRAQAAVRKWQRTDTPPTAADSEVLNEALEDEWRALPIGEAVRLAFQATDRLDEIIEGLGPRMVAEILSTGNSRLLSRSPHRDEHIAQIELALRAGER